MPRLVFTCANPRKFKKLNEFCEKATRRSEKIMGLEPGFNQWQLIVPAACSANCHDIEIDVIFSAGAVENVKDADDARRIAAQIEVFCERTPLLAAGTTYGVWPMGHRIAGYGEGGVVQGPKDEPS